MLKVAQYAAQLEDYDKAIQIYESVASSCLDSSLLKYSAKEYFFRASLCHLSVDLLNAQHALDKYANQYPAFQDSREFKLVKVSNIRFLLFFFNVSNNILFLSVFRHLSSIWKNRILTATQKQSKNMIAFRVWISGTRQFSCVLRNNITIIPICDKFPQACN